MGPDFTCSSLVALYSSVRNFPSDATPTCSPWDGEKQEKPVWVAVFTYFVVQKKKRKEHVRFELMILLPGERGSLDRRAEP